MINKAYNLTKSVIIMSVSTFQGRYVGYFSKVRYELDGKLPAKRYIKIVGLIINAIKGNIYVLLL